MPGAYDLPSRVGDVLEDFEIRFPCVVSLTTDLGHGEQRLASSPWNGRAHQVSSTV